MMPASAVGQAPARTRIERSPRRRPPMPAGRSRFDRGGLPMAAIAVSALGHVLFFTVLAGVVMWTAWNRPRVYIVNLAPAVAAVGLPTAPAVHSTPVRAQAPAPALPARAPVPDAAPREPVAREPARLPEPSWSTPRLPARPALPRPGEKELPPMAGPRVASTTTTPTPRLEKTDKPVESRPALGATLGRPTGSAAGVGALTTDSSDFPYAWYLRQVLQKVQGEWQRQNRANEPDQKPLVFVEIQRDGSIRLPKIEQSSGNSTYDQAALRAVVDASPFPPLPPDWSRPSLRVMFRFDLMRDRG